MATRIVNMVEGYWYRVEQPQRHECCCCGAKHDVWVRAVYRHEPDDRPTFYWRWRRVDDEKASTTMAKGGGKGKAKKKGEGKP